MVRGMKRTLLAAALGLTVGCSSASNPPGPAAGGDSGVADASPGDATAPDTWASYASGFFATYCVACHNAQDTTGRDYRVQANVAKDKAVMRCGVAATQDPSWNCAPTPVAKQFPIGSGPKPTDAERARIVAWITAGEP
jgi:hypothetical protein